MRTFTCIRTMDCGQAVCSVFLPSDRHVRPTSFMLWFSVLLNFSQIAVGTKTGDILLYDLASSSLIETIKAHVGTVWSLHIPAEKQSLISGSADKSVKFWDFEHKAAASDDDVGSLLQCAVLQRCNCCAGTGPEAGLSRSHPHFENVG
jgi:U3 small nucleolar RNA-associated protein 12